MTIIYTDPVFGRHKTPSGHPECAERFAAAERALSHPKFEPLERRTAGPVPADAVFVPITQAGANVIAASLEPDSPGSHVGVGVVE